MVGDYTSKSQCFWDKCCLTGAREAVWDRELLKSGKVLK